MSYLLSRSCILSITICLNFLISNFAFADYQINTAGVCKTLNPVKYIGYNNVNGKLSNCIQYIENFKNELFVETSSPDYITADFIKALFDSRYNSTNVTAENISFCSVNWEPYEIPYVITTNNNYTLDTHCLLTLCPLNSTWSYCRNLTTQKPINLSGPELQALIDLYIKKCPNGYDYNTSSCIQTCTDGIRNQDETGIDCGGSCAACTAGTCNDGIKNQDESDIDCGGTICQKCKCFQKCNSNSDCDIGYWYNNNTAYLYGCNNSVDTWVREMILQDPAENYPIDPTLPNDGSVKVCDCSTG